ncbi:MAG: SusD/RagB family nutrient-binding outer membrane lipoprotein [Psychroserpens sp.]|uniref:SusD/RagB family nutrient-binding outer membrane lipoprotein n=1 Tax=Psychroserpens sp. TaxID=2020870 RepID=UPI003C78ED56
MMKKINKNIFWALSLLVLISCETTELDLLNDPNVPSPDSIDVDFTLNSIQFNFSEFYEEATEPGGEAVRLEYMFDTYQINFNNTNPNMGNMWSNAYAGVLEDVKILLPIAEENSLFYHEGVARTLKAYVLLTLVDYFGDVPLTEALRGDEGILFPVVDEGSTVYQAAFDELNLANTAFNNITSGTPIPNDLFYDGNSSSWTKLVNSLLLKYHLNRRLIDESGSASAIAALVNGGEIISDNADSFLWQASTSTGPLSKHQYYVEEYQAANPGEYIPNYLAWALTEEKGIDDPRLRYYIYRQVDAFPESEADLNNEIDCWNDPRPVTYAPIDAISAVPLPFCSLFDRGDGYWGRDHSENDGIPPDNAKRMTFGSYPVGGRFDDDDAESISDGEGLNGAGLWPIMMDSFVYFMRAEAALYLGTSDNPRAMYESGIRASISKVMEYIPGGSFDNIPTDDDVEDYVDAALGLYDAESDADGRMGVVAKEYWIAMFGNGVEGYNLYRRTGAPYNLQPTYLGTGTFPRSFLYPSNTVDRNPNMSQKPDLTIQVFWDNNPAGFIQ